jgi:hypothetical protein
MAEVSLVAALMGSNPQAASLRKWPSRSTTESEQWVKLAQQELPVPLMEMVRSTEVT